MADAVRGWPGYRTGEGQQGVNQEGSSEWSGYKLNNDDLLPDIFKVFSNITLSLVNNFQNVWSLNELFINDVIHEPFINDVINELFMNDVINQTFTNDVIYEPLINGVIYKSFINEPFMNEAQRFW